MKIRHKKPQHNGPDRKIDIAAPKNIITCIKTRQTPAEQSVSAGINYTKPGIMLAIHPNPLDSLEKRQYGCENGHRLTKQIKWFHLFNHLLYRKGFQLAPNYERHRPPSPGAGIKERSKNRIYIWIWWGRRRVARTEDE